MFKKTVCAIAVFIVVALMLTIYAGSVAEKNLVITGSTTMQSLVDIISRGYSSNSGVSVFVAGGGSGKGIKDVMSGNSDIGMVSRSLKEEEKKDVSSKTIAYDALVFIVNNRNPINQINHDDIVKIFTGQIKSWDQLGLNFNQPIVLVSKEKGRATLELFETYSGLAHPSNEKSGKNGYISKSSYEIASNQEGATLTGGIAGAIGYISLGTAVELIEMGMPIKILMLDGVQPSRETVVNKTYPVIRELNLVYKQDNAPANDFVEYCLSSEAQRIVEQNGSIPIK